MNMNPGTITQDCDAFLFGSRRIYRNFFKPETVEEYRMEDITNELGFDRAALICLALLLGSDYCVGIRGVGIVNATEIIATFPGYDGLKNFRDWVNAVQDNSSANDFDAVKDFKKKHEKARKKWLLEEDFPNKVREPSYIYINYDYVGLVNSY
jgi:DNA excision repair protein ERCC-5